MTRRLRRTYGARPLHLIGLLASFALAAAGFIGWFQRPRDVAGVLEWLAAAIVLHDLVLMPLYALIDRITIGLLHRRVVLTREVPPLISPTPYVRVPAMISMLVFAVQFPVILGLGSQTELAASGIREHGYLARWLLASGALFALSGAAYTIARARLQPRAPRTRLTRSAPR